MLTSAEAASTVRVALGDSDDGQVTSPQHRGSRILVSREPLATPGGRRPKPAETLLAVSKVVGSNLDLAEVLRQTTRELARALRADIGSVWRLEPSERALRRVAGYRVPRTVRTEESSSLAFARLLTPAQRKSAAPIYSSNSAGQRRFDHPFLNLVRHRSLLIQPFRVGDELAGVFVLVWTRARHRFTGVELRLVEAIAQQAGVAIANAELLAETQRFTYELERRVASRTARLKQAYEELRSSREELRALTTHTEQVREQERTRISREIHDELGQALTALKMDLATLGATSGAADGGHEAAPRRLIDLVDHMIASVRRIASELRPQILDDLGLLAALEWQAQDFAIRTGIKCRFRCAGAPNGLDTERSTALFRIFQEILTNVARHAAATHLQVRLAIGPASVRLDVRDDGRGMGELPSDRPHLGLLGMRERAAAFGGRIAFVSRPHQGTQVRVRIPLPRTRGSDPLIPDPLSNHAGHHRVRRPSRRSSGTGRNHSKQAAGR
jgi:signal transduction histidine kinase